MPETSSSVEEATASACPALSLRELAMPANPDIASVRTRIWSSAPSDTSVATTAMAFAESVTCCAWVSTSVGSSVPCPLRCPLPLVERFCVAMTVSRRLRGQYRLGRVEQGTEVENHDQSIVQRGDAADVARADAGQPVAGRLNRRRRDGEELAAGVDQQPDDESRSL